MGMEVALAVICQWLIRPEQILTQLSLSLSLIFFFLTGHTLQRQRLRIDGGMVESERVLYIHEVQTTLIPVQ